MCWCGGIAADARGKRESVASQPKPRSFCSSLSNHSSRGFCSYFKLSSMMLVRCAPARHLGRVIWARYARTNHQHTGTPLPDVQVVPQHITLTIYGFIAFLTPSMTSSSPRCISLQSHGGLTQGLFFVPQSHRQSITSLVAIYE